MGRLLGRRATKASRGLSCEGEEESGTGQRREKKMTVGAHASVTGEGSYNKVYVFVYTCSWAQVRFICIP
jgi:hypothetical protein